MRNGPHPLPLHLGMAMKDAVAEDLRLGIKVPHALKEYELIEMVRGIQMYQLHSFRPRRLPRYAVWRGQGGAALFSPTPPRRHNKLHNGKVPLVLVPSLINSSDILDLCRQRSLLRSLNSNGHQVFMFDWGRFNKFELHHMNMDDLLKQRLVPALDEISNHAKNQIDCLGYCMGGLLMLAGLSKLPDDIIRKQILLATPWDFHAPSMRLTDHVGFWLPSARPAMRGKGYLPAGWLQSLFATLEPEGTARKFIKFASMEQESEEAKLFVLTEDWLNKGIDLPLRIAEECIQSWFIRNEPYKNGEVSGQNISQRIGKTKQTLIISSKGDRLVSQDSAKSISKIMPNSSLQFLDLSCGHIGFIAGKRSVETVWQPMSDWIRH